MTQTGLTQAQALTRLRQWGPNRLSAPKPHARLKEILRTLSDPMAVMLVLASIVYFLLGEVRDGAILLAALVPVLGVDVLLEARSRDALKKLSQALAPQARVIRDGVERIIPSEELVPGDLVLLAEGDKVLADGELLETANLSVDESALTGESEPVTKRPYHGDTETRRTAPVSKTEPDNESLHRQDAKTPRTPADLGNNQEKSNENKPDSEGRFFAGSTVLTGHARGEVTETGLRTRYGKIAELVSGVEIGQSPLQKKVGAMVSRLYGAAGVAALAMVGLGLYRGLGWGPAFLSGVSLAIAAIPEEFPLVFTIFLSLGAWRLSKHGVLLKRLACVETLGSTTVICVDKTGTLTQGNFELDSHQPLNSAFSEEAVLEASVLACELSPADPMERAILRHSQEHGVQVLHVQEKWDLVHDYDFDPVGKHMSHVWRNRSDPGAWRIVAKGALEGILEHCAIGEAERKAAEGENERLASHGARVLAVASRDGGAFSGDRKEDERELKFMGLLAFRDPLRPEVPGAVALCQAAGIRVKIITGDHLLTAHAVADAAGITHEPEDLLNASVLTGLSTGELTAKAEKGVVFARVQPEQKFALVKALKEAGEVVAMTGDGINDAPALKLADIGIAMGLKGTEVARASADMVLLTDSFAGIVKTIEEGRRIFGNIQRSFLFLIGFHIPIVGLALLCPLLGYPLFYLPIHLVWLELIVHPVSALVFEAEPAPPDSMLRPPRDPAAPLLANREILLSAVSGGLLTLTTLFVYVTHLSQGQPYARGAGLAALILGVLLLTWAERAGGKAWWRVPFPRTFRFWAVWVLVAVSLWAILEIPWLSGIFQVEVLSGKDWLGAGGLAFGAVGWRIFGMKTPILKH
jgi:Ca2+-transporting ATPase